MSNTETIATARADRGRGLIVAGVWLAALVMVVPGVWMLADPASFAEFAEFLPHVHFAHDAGAFQIGIGVMLLLSLVWQDALAVTLTGFVVGNTIHAVNHGVDLDLGGRGSDPWTLLAVSLVIGAALWLRLRQLDYVVGEVTTATAPALAPFVRQKTALLTTYRRDGQQGSSPLSVAVDGDHAYLRSFEKSLKTKRMRRIPEAELRPSTQRGRPTGAPLHGRVRELHGQEYRHAAKLLRRKHPFLHGLAVPFMHRAMRGRFGRTVHFEFAPDLAAPPSGAPN